MALFLSAINSMLARCREPDALLIKICEGNVSGKLSDERFMMITKRYDGEQLALKMISSLQAEINEENRLRQSAAGFLQTMKRIPVPGYPQ